MVKFLFSQLVVVARVSQQVKSSTTLMTGQKCLHLNLIIPSQRLHTTIACRSLHLTLYSRRYSFKRILPSRLQTTLESKGSLLTEVTKHFPNQGGCQAGSGMWSFDNFRF
ncbi:hypothetical protein BCR41DRAFT_154006 [Lobosporangium transversale]|uniref:Uncharacterized protein n=1 Tax=Lobosporangium transversale TaxID=64571 RepID=A0A1Y2GZX8_9FUNG|nr:hypothetical protein BCR41DRAFT_154006 [Lobosporangium transversale]ORZ27344.1 hypothetical protein BCR41DRAFT_154006 [Lobosporangium transversale]|eukprot:XP_021885071.1 hypothetical protein BCR41DRAFT_154006 [Lobosporangium transversale]